MPNEYNIGIYMTGNGNAIGKVADMLNHLKQNDKIFGALIGSPAQSTADAFTAYYGVAKDVKKAAFEYTIHSPAEIFANLQTSRDIPRGFLQQLSAKNGIKIDVEYDSANDDITGKICFDNGETIAENTYKFIEGKYLLDSETDKSIFLGRAGNND